MAETGTGAVSEQSHSSHRKHPADCSSDGHGQGDGHGTHGTQRMDVAPMTKDLQWMKFPHGVPATPQCRSALRPSRGLGVSEIAAQQGLDGFQAQPEGRAPEIPLSILRTDISCLAFLFVIIALK